MQYSNEREFWSVGKSEWNRWHVRKASTEEPDEYTVVEDLGPVYIRQQGALVEPIKSAGLEFDGDFNLNLDQVVAFYSTSNPWLYVLMTDGRLYVKRAGIVEEPQLLASDVIDASLCRSWRSVKNNADQGLILGYIKTDGTAWYRERYPVNGVYVWGNPAQIPQSGFSNTSIKCFRLNDFRIGIFVGGTNKIFISRRTYISNTIKDEVVYLKGPTPNFLVFSNRDGELESLDPLQVQSISFITDSLIEVQFNFPVFDYDPTWNDITWTGSLPAGQSISSLEFTQGKLLIHLSMPMPSRRMELKFKCRALNRKGYFVSDNAKPIWPELEIHKPREPIIIDNSNQGVGLVALHADLVSFDCIPLRYLKYAHEEQVLLNLSGDCSFDCIRLGELKTSSEEVVEIALSGTCVFDCQQTDPHPI